MFIFILKIFLLILSELFDGFILNVFKRVFYLIKYEIYNLLTIYFIQTF